MSPTPKLKGDPPNPSGLCMCGCGGKTSLARQGSSLNGDIYGEYKRYINGHATYSSFKEYTVDDITGCWIWNRFTDKNGYGKAYIRNDGPSRSYTQIVAHRLIYIREVGEIPEGKVLHHKCHNPSCVNPSHMDVVTQSAHRRKHAKFSEEDIASIRLRRSNGETSTAIAKSIGVSQPLISMIVHGQRY